MVICVSINKFILIIVDYKGVGLLSLSVSVSRSRDHKSLVYYMFVMQFVCKHFKKSGAGNTIPSSKFHLKWGR